MRKFPVYRQTDQKDSDATCLKIIARYYGRKMEIRHLRELSETTGEATSLPGLSEAAEQIGFHTIGIKADYKKLLEVPLPFLHWNKGHFVVLCKMEKGSAQGSDYHSNQIPNIRLLKAPYGI